MPTTVHIPEALLESIDRRARALGVSRNRLIVRALEQAVRERSTCRTQGAIRLVCSELRRAEWTDAVSQSYGRIKAALERRGVRIEDFDAAIAAHALALGATLVTANIAHMTRVAGLRVEGWTA